MATTLVDPLDVPTTYIYYKPTFHNQRMQMITEGGHYRFVLPFAPREIEYGGLTGDWVEAERTGTTPLLMRKSSRLPTIRFSVMVTHPRVMHWRQNGPIRHLKLLARTRGRVLVKYSQYEAGVWRVTDCTITSMLRHPENSDITRAVVSITLTRASDPVSNVGPISGGKKSPAKKTKTKKKAPRKYTIKKGDTLWKIASIYYKNGAAWPRIYDANRKKIKNPHKLVPKTVIVLP